MSLLLSIIAALFLPPPWVNILKPVGNPATLLCSVYGYCTNAMSTLCCRIDCVSFEAATLECCMFTCKHLGLTFLFTNLDPLRMSLSISGCRAIVSNRYSVYIFLKLLAY